MRMCSTGWFSGQLLLTEYLRADVLQLLLEETKRRKRISASFEHSDVLFLQMLSMDSIQRIKDGRRAAQDQLAGASQSRPGISRFRV